MKKVAFLLLLLISSISFFSQFPDRYLHVIVCDVGQGDGILITKGYTQVVIDGGPNDRILDCIGSHIPFWDKQIELVVNTHADLDHYAGFVSLLDRYEVSTFLKSGVDSEAKEYQLLLKKLQDKNISTSVAHTGQKIIVGDLNFDVIFPTNQFIETHSKVSRNDFSAILYLKYGKFTSLFTGDTQPPSEHQMLDLGVVPEAYFLKIPHHGSKNGLIEDFLNKVKPKVAAISVGLKNKFGHPDQSIIDLLNKYKIKTLRTDSDGEIELVTDGSHVWARNP